MVHFEVRGGLRKLEFQGSPGSGHEAEYAVVEFVHVAPLPAGQSARITLGRHNGVVRELVGIPELVQLNRTNANEYLYRLRGAITEAHD
jgi:hypothetical protein